MQAMSLWSFDFFGWKSFKTLIISSEFTGVRNKLCLLDSCKRDFKSPLLQLLILLFTFLQISLKKN